MQSDASTLQAPGHRAGLTIGDKVALALLIIGGINWLLVGAFGIDIVASIFGPMSVLSRIVYVVVGICALYSLSLYARRP